MILDVGGQTYISFDNRKYELSENHDVQKQIIRVNVGNLYDYIISVWPST